MKIGYKSFYFTKLPQDNTPWFYIYGNYWGRILWLCWCTSHTRKEAFDYGEQIFK